MKRKLIFKDYKGCLDPSQIENKTSHLEKNNLGINVLTVIKESNQLIQ